MFIVQLTGNVSDLLSDAGGTLIMVTDSAGSKYIFALSLLLEDVFYSQIISI